MAPHNKVFEVEQEGDRVTINVGERGRFELSWLSAEGIVTLRSPLRGEFKYSYDWGRETWLCTTDGHLLLDLLTRDLIYCCNGFPKF